MYWKNVHELLETINERKIETFFIRANWDNSPNYDQLLKLIKKLSYIKEISEKVEEFRGLKILGLPYSFTNDIKAIRYLSKEFQEPLDLVLAHAEYKRRVWLFHLNAKLVITGHFDRQLCQIQDKLFISLENFPGQYVVIDYKSSRYKIRYFDGVGDTVLRKAKFSSGKLIWEAKPFKNRRQYANKIERLMAAKERIIIGNTKSQEITNRLIKDGIPKRQIEEYIGTWATRNQAGDNKELADRKLMKEMEEAGVLEW